MAQTGAFQRLFFAALLGIFCCRSAPAQGAYATQSGLSGEAVEAPAVDEQLLAARRTVLDPDRSAYTLQHMEELFHFARVARGDSVWGIGRSNRKLGAIKYRAGAEVLTLDDFLERTYTNALLIIKQGEIVLEIYRNGASAATRFWSFSVGKSIISTLVGAAIDDGFINSVEDQLTGYVPELQSTAYAGVTIRDTLQMTSGVNWVESYNLEEARTGRRAMMAEMVDLALNQNTIRAVQYANRLQRTAAPGQQFNYATINTVILGWLVEKATGKSNSAYLSERIWKPAGMESDATWLLDGPPGVGREFATALNITLRDYGRFGLMMLNEGRANSRQIISSTWVREATQPDRAHLLPGGLSEGNPFGYQYQWWKFPDGQTYAALGHLGQMIYVNPEESLVVVKLSHWPPGRAMALQLETNAFLEALVNAPFNE